MIDVLIIGSGPAGYTAGIYAARGNLKTVMISGYDEGGQLMLTTDVENYPGFAHAIHGPTLMEQMKKQVENLGVQLVSDMVESVDFLKKPFTIKTESGQTFLAKSIIIATGAQAKWLGIPSEKHFQGYGVSGCATCDGFFFKDKSVAVIGGGNTAVEEAIYLTNHAKEVILVHRRNTLKAEKILQDRLFANTKIKVIWNADVHEIIGKENPKTVTGLTLNMKTGTQITIDIDGVFVAIGHKPATDLFKNTTLHLDSEGYIKVDGVKTNISGVFAAGDVQDKIYRQAVTAASTGCMSALEAQKWLESC